MRTMTEWLVQPGVALEYVDVLLLNLNRYTGYFSIIRDMYGHPTALVNEAMKMAIPWSSVEHVKIHEERE